MTPRILALSPLLALGLGACGPNETPLPRAAYVPGDPVALECTPNLDGRIDADEVATAFGVPLSYLVSPDGQSRTVDLAGSIDANGQRVWDWGEDRAEDGIWQVAAQPLEAQWFADAFPNGQFVTEATTDGDSLGIYRRDEGSLWLLGLASAHDGVDRTLLVYEPPLEALRFPLEAGAHWVSSGTISQGELFGLPYAGTDTWTVDVVATGRLVLPDLTFAQALQVRTHVAIEPVVGAPTSVRQASFFFECFGEVARATSHDDEPSDDFTSAAQVRRLGLDSGSVGGR